VSVQKSYSKFLSELEIYSKKYPNDITEQNFNILFSQQNFLCNDQDQINSFPPLKHYCLLSMSKFKWKFSCKSV